MTKTESDILNTAKRILLTFRNQNVENLQKAFAVLLQYEQPETMAMDRRGAAGLFEWYKFKAVGLLVERKDGQIIEVREKKF
jgi:hypothetical protein